jgi:5-methylcytosine-specific restriction enzyme subunit McrC
MPMLTNKRRILLDIYFEWFLDEVQLLIHQGQLQYYKRRTMLKLKGKAGVLQDTYKET